MTFLCRISNSGPHLLHVHDSPSSYVDILRHQEMGWELSATCQLPDEPWTDGNPGAKPFLVVDLTQKADALNEYADSLEAVSFDDSDEYDELETESELLGNRNEEDEDRLQEIEERQTEIREDVMNLVDDAIAELSI